MELTKAKMFSIASRENMEKTVVASSTSVQELQTQEVKPDLSNPKDLLILDEQLRKKSSAIPKMCKRFCRCFSLAFGSYIVGCVTVGSSVVGAVHMFEELTTITDTWMESTSEGVFDFMTLVALCLHTVLCVIGIVILYGLIHNKIKLVKYVSLALLVASIFRLVVAIVRLIVSQDIEAFLFFFVNGSFYLYGFVVIWSFAVDEEESQRLNILANYEIAQIAQRFGHRSSICAPNN